MNLLQKSMLKTSKNYFNLGKFALFLLLCIIVAIFITNCGSSTASNDEGTPPVTPPVPSPLELGDISLVASTGDSSPYAAATVTIEGAVIVISGITNLADATAETLTLSVADRDNPAAYTVEPASIMIPGTVLNPGGTNVVTNRVEGSQFVLTPVAAGSEAITYSIEVRLAEFVAPPVLLPSFAVADITITPSGGASSPYAAASVAVLGESIIISGITNRDDALRGETLTVTIADTDTPADYTAEPSSVTIPADVLNPDGIAVVRAAVPNVAFVLTPVAAGGTAVTYNVELRLDALPPPPPLMVADITFADGKDPFFSSANVVSLNDNVITIGSIINRENGFVIPADLTLTVAQGYTVTERGMRITGTGNDLILSREAFSVNGINGFTTTTNDNLAFAVESAASPSTAVTYYVRLAFKDLIRLDLFSAELQGRVALLEGNPRTTITIKNCAVASSFGSYEIFVGGVRSTSYALTSTIINPYTNTETSLVISEGNEERATFPVSIMSPCTKDALSGTGTSGGPYIIDNDRKLDLVARLVNANTDNYRTAHYRVDANINLGGVEAPWWRTDTTTDTPTTPNGAGFTPIGTGANKFTGTFNCNEKEISNLYINRVTTDYVGLLGYTSGATIQNCRLLDADVTGNSFIGGLVGRMDRSTVSSSYVIGRVTGGRVGEGINSGTNVGGLVGLIYDSSTISDSYVYVKSLGTGRSGVIIGTANIGGLVGFSDNSTISTSYISTSTGNVALLSGNSGGAFGGLVGRNLGSGSINNSHAFVLVSGGTPVGGLVGSNSATINNSYSAGVVLASPGGTGIGGLVGVNSGTVNRSFWNTSIPPSAPHTVSAGGTGKTDAELKALTTATTGGWSGTIWDFTAGQYPRLKTVVCANRQHPSNPNNVPTECTDL